MTITEKTILLYTIDSLPTEKAKDTARDEWRNSPYAIDLSNVIEDAKTVAALFGFNIDGVEWSGYSYQGGAASAVGSYKYKKGALAAVKEDTPGDAELHAIVQRLQDIQRHHSYQLRAETTTYSSCSVLCADVTQFKTQQDAYYPVEADVANTLTQILADFSEWIYKRLDAENDYLNSDEVIDDILLTNEYTFDEAGNRQ